MKVSLSPNESAPRLIRDEDFMSGDVTFRLRIPKRWLITTRYPRLAIVLFLLRILMARSAEEPR